MWSQSQFALAISYCLREQGPTSLPLFPSGFAMVSNVDFTSLRLATKPAISRL